jgi:hypothetical protein
MKTSIKGFIEQFGLTCLLLLAVIFWITGCSAPKPAPDPLVGWKRVYLSEPNKAIVEDYRDYIQKLPPTEKKFVDEYSVDFFENDTGSHAIKIEVLLNGTYWEHVLVYDRNNKRINTIKYSAGHYRS